LTATSDTGAKSARDAKGGDFCTMGMVDIEASAQSSTEPSVGAPASACAASTPLAPGRLSLTTGWPSALLSDCPSARAAKSDGPPAPPGITMRMGLAGCAATAGITSPIESPANSNAMSFFIVLVLRLSRWGNDTKSEIRAKASRR